MITTEQKREIEIVGDFKQKEFRIKATPKSFKILIGNLYSDKVSALIRELSQNARDAQVAAGTENTPFRVKLPTYYEDSSFSIRDFGTGMSHSFMMNQYTHVFHSSKDESNDYAGQLGIGRLVSLSLCDSYVCSSFQKGTKRNYSVILNEDSIPEIIFLNEEATTEPDGFEVTVPVESNLSTDFTNKAKEIYRFFKVKPVIINQPNFQIPENKFIVSATDGSWGLMGRHNKAVALMGNYAYPLVSSSITGITSGCMRLLECGLIVNFNIGELEVQANREGLHYNKVTVENIKKKLESILPQIEPIVTKHFENKTLFDKILLQNSIFSYNGKLSAISSLASDFIRKLKIPQYVEFENIKAVKFYARAHRSRISSGEITRYEFGSDTDSRYCDKGTYMKLRAKKFFSDFNNRSKTLLVLSEALPGAFAAFKAKYGFDITQLPKTSALPFDKPQVYQASPKIAGQIEAWVYKNAWRHCFVSKEIVKTTDSILYVQKHGNVISDHDTQGTRDFENKINEYNNLTGKTIKVYGLTGRQIKDKPATWVDFFEAYKVEREKLQKAQRERIANYLYFQVHYCNMPDFIVRLGRKVKPESTLAKIIAEYDSIKKDLSSFNSSLVAGTDIKASDKFLFNSRLIYSAYPLLKAIYENSVNSGVEKELIEYVNQKCG